MEPPLCWHGRLPPHAHDSVNAPAAGADASANITTASQRLEQEQGQPIARPGLSSVTDRAEPESSLFTRLFSQLNADYPFRRSDALNCYFLEINVFFTISR